MNHKMNRDNRVLLILVTLVVVAILTTFWSVTGPFGSPPERQRWGRWNLTQERRREIVWLVQNMSASGSSWREINSAIRTKFLEWGSNPPPSGDIELFYTIKTVISTINVTLGIILFLTYIDIYLKTKSEFTVGLIIFSIVLLFYTLSSNPLMQWFFGFRAFGLGPFAMLPELFSCIALCSLLYLSFK